MNLKERYNRFKAWQHNPFRYSINAGKTEICQNCGNKFMGNYCPVCGQKGGVGRIGWDSVRQGVMILWGLDTRSLSYSIVQLLLRPGYFISDYISGRRQVSFPPVKMLFIVAIFNILVTRLSHWLYGKPDVVSTLTEEDFDATFLLRYLEWTEANVGWSTLINATLFILPVWLLFRRSPHNTHHSLPEGFFIQVFMGTLTLVVSSVGELVGKWILWLVPVYCIIAYRQLFGYGLWGTLWRFFICLFVVFCVMIACVVVVYLIYN